MATKARLPLTVIGGFLGAGKTTLVNHWLRESRGLRIAVLVNDFGALNVDAELIASASGDTIALTNGCVCCQIGDDLSRALIAVLDSSIPFDAVLVEASGVSDPWRIAQLGLADPGLSLGSVIVLVDAGDALQQARDPLLADTLERQLRAGDLIVLNKADRSTHDELARIREWVVRIAGQTPTLETTQAQLPIALLADLAPALAHTLRHASLPECDYEGHGVHPPDHGELFETWSCQPRRVFEAADLRQWLHRAPVGLLRLKGLVQTGRDEWSEIQFAGRHVSVRRSGMRSGGGVVVAIGLRGQLPKSALIQNFNDL
ncbi:MAG: CobW family GTP-binding protein [Variovorax sp.]